MNAERTDAPDGRQKKQLPIPPVPIMESGSGQVGQKDELSMLSSLFLPFYGASSAVELIVPSQYLPNLKHPELAVTVDKQAYKSLMGHFVDFNITGFGGMVGVWYEAKDFPGKEDVYYLGDRKSIEDARKLIAGMHSQLGHPKFKLTAIDSVRRAIYGLRDFKANVELGYEASAPHPRTAAGGANKGGASSSGMVIGEKAFLWLTSQTMNPKELEKKVVFPLFGASNGKRFMTEEPHVPRKITVIDLREKTGMDDFATEMSEMF